MSALTTFLGLYKPGGGSSGSITPDEVVDVDRLNNNSDLIDANAKSVDDKFTTNRSTTGFVPAVTGTAQRNALFPAPAQGDRVHRLDLGYDQVYFALYNAGSNPGGMPSAGWDRFDARVRQSGESTGLSTDVNGDISLVHGLPVTPNRVQLTVINSGTLPNRITLVRAAVSSTNLRVRAFRQDTGEAFGFNGVDFYWEVRVDA